MYLWIKMYDFYVKRFNLFQIVVAETDVFHSGVYQCEPGSAPTAKVNVHVLDGEFFVPMAHTVLPMAHVHLPMACTVHTILPIAYTREPMAHLLLPRANTYCIQTCTYCS